MSLQHPVTLRPPAFHSETASAVLFLIRTLTRGKGLQRKKQKMLCVLSREELSEGGWLQSNPDFLIPVLSVCLTPNPLSAPTQPQRTPKCLHGTDHQHFPQTRMDLPVQLLRQLRTLGLDSLESSFT